MALGTSDGRRELNLEILDGKITFRDAFRDMLASIPLPFEECKEILKRDIKLDPGFAQFYAWCKSADIPFVIVSSGMEPLIRAVLVNLIGEEDAASIDIISNDVMTDETGRWRIKYRHPDRRVLGFGHDKSQAILPYRQLDSPPVLFFFGDGVSGESISPLTVTRFFYPLGGWTPPNMELHIHIPSSWSSRAPSPHLTSALLVSSSMSPD
ncbi:hypothetical protein PIIN_11226 [Serendipita indica DSM 11827]|uniref:Uncharacterized protein n=1 Tax=Serendipita indica (strain DSM 11827) TaxID=1109443 RepID=G4U102_SERID|nr:hypothetical protein PIIN_11226 [Serendipita indica DSM 11827]